MDAVEDVKSRLSIEDVIGEYVELKRSGRNLKGLSPFNPERTPSFMVSPEKQIWHDFSSGRGGNMFSFVMEMEGVDFKGALEILARKANIDLGQYRRGDGSARRMRDQAAAALELAAKYYQQSLLQNEAARDYVVKKRNFNKSTLSNFRLGYAPNTGKALVDFLRKRKFEIQTLRAAGLVGRYGSDMFRGRVMIPLMDPQGQVVGFTARLLADEPDAPKYINTPQTVLYDKSRHVFGLHLAKDAIRRAGFAVIVEGNLDVLSSHQAGYANVVATAGTAMTTQQLKAIGRFTSDIRLSYDQDSAGLAAAERAIAVAQGVGVQLSIITIPSGKDPDELIQKNPAAWEAAMYAPQYAIDWLIERYQQLYDITSASGKRQFSDTLLATVSRLADTVERDHYLLKLAEMTEVSEAAMRSKLEQFQQQNGKLLKKRRVTDEATEHPAPEALYEDQLLSLLVAYPITRRLLETDAYRLVFSTPERQRVYEYVEANPTVTLTDEIPEDLKDVDDYVKILLFKAEELYNSFDANERLRELRDLVNRLTTKYQKDKKQKLAAEIRQAEEAGDEVRVASLLEQFNTLLKQD